MTIPRLYISTPCFARAEIPLDRDQSHYLIKVLRRKSGDPVFVFNGREGEWRTLLALDGAKLICVEQTRKQASVPDLALLFAPVKRAGTHMILEKATELGVKSIQPVKTERTETSQLHLRRWGAILREAAEQTERLDIPELYAFKTLKSCLESWPQDRGLLVCDEGRRNGQYPNEKKIQKPELLSQEKIETHPDLLSVGQKFISPEPESLTSSVSRLKTSTSSGYTAIFDLREFQKRGYKKAAILTGPEGGFTEREQKLFSLYDFVMPFVLGPRILRAETAVIAALTLFQAHAGDWSDKSDF